jgi:hypothetical protein
MIKNMASPRYAESDQASLQNQIVSISDATDEINTFAAQPGAFLEMGQVLYPRFFGKEDGLASTTPWPSYAIREYPRVGFMFLNQTSTSVVFPTKRLEEFPHAQDAIILGCQKDGYVEARWIVFPALDSVYTSEEISGPCSP